MTARPTVRLLLPATLALLAACAGQPPKHIVSVSGQGDCPKKLVVGQTLLVMLPTNPTTGFRWSITDPAASVLKSLGPEVYSNPEDAGVVGGAGQSTWRYLVSTAGSAHLKMAYQQPWAPEVVPEQTFDCAIDVN